MILTVCIISQSSRTELQSISLYLSTGFEAHGKMTDCFVAVLRRAVFVL